MRKSKYKLGDVRYRTLFTFLPKIIDEEKVYFGFYIVYETLCRDEKGNLKWMFRELV